MTTNVDKSLGSLLEPVARCFTPEVARRLVELQADPAVQSRVAELATKANEGTLSTQEQAEYDRYIEVADIVGILQAKARTMLSGQKA
jgi:hypothetical protein